MLLYRYFVFLHYVTLPFPAVLLPFLLLTETETLVLSFLKLCCVRVFEDKFDVCALSTLSNTATYSSSSSSFTYRSCHLPAPPTSLCHQGVSLFYFLLSDFSLPKSKRVNVPRQQQLNTHSCRSTSYVLQLRSHFLHLIPPSFHHSLALTSSSVTRSNSDITPL